MEPEVHKLDELDVLFVLNQGIGNITEMIPLYLCLKEAGIKMDVVYFKEYSRDNVENCACFPTQISDEINGYELERIRDSYDYVIRPPFLTKKGEKEHEYSDKHTDSFYELDSEVRRNLNILEEFGIKKEIKKDLFLWPSPYEGDFVICNGALKGWERKRYPHMQEVALTLTRMGYKVTSIGSKEEYVQGTFDATGTALRKSAGTIANHKVFIGTDTGTYHVAACMNKPGVAIFTCTDPMKNYDKEFHKSFSIASALLPCQPCQRGYHYWPEFSTCQEVMCQNLHPDVVVSMALSKLKGIK